MILERQPRPARTAALHTVLAAIGIALAIQTAILVAIISVFRQ